jgi:polyisoprenoid-binding protein YceI
MKIRCITLLPWIAITLLTRVALGQVPAFDITPISSMIKFNVTASVPIAGSFDKWDASLTFTSAEATSAILDLQIQAATVNTGSGMKNDKLKSTDFFDVKQNPLITFKSTKIIQTSPTTFDVKGIFTIRGVSKPEILQLTLIGRGTGQGTITGVMAFDRKDFGMNSGIPFIRIADRVEVDVSLHFKQLSGPRVTYKE